MSDFGDRPEFPPQQQAYINTDARKIRWLRGMLRWAVRLAKEKRHGLFLVGEAVGRLEAAATESERLSEMVAKTFAERTEQVINLGENCLRLQAENEALRQAGRGLYAFVNNQSDVSAAWRKVDPE